MPTINEQVLPPGAICWTRQLKGEFKEQSKKVGMILGHDGTDEDGASACERTVLARGRSSAPRSACSAAWRLAVARAARPGPLQG